MSAVYAHVSETLCLEHPNVAGNAFHPEAVANKLCPDVACAGIWYMVTDAIAMSLVASGGVLCLGMYLLMAIRYDLIKCRVITNRLPSPFALIELYIFVFSWIEELQNSVVSFISPFFLVELSKKTRNIVIISTHAQFIWYTFKWHTPVIGSVQLSSTNKIPIVSTVSQYKVQIYHYLHIKLINIRACLQRQLAMQSEIRRDWDQAWFSQMIFTGVDGDTWPYVAIISSHVINIPMPTFLTTRWMFQLNGELCKWTFNPVCQMGVFLNNK